MPPEKEELSYKVKQQIVKRLSEFLLQFLIRHAGLVLNLNFNTYENAGSASGLTVTDFEYVARYTVRRQNNTNYLEGKCACMPFIVHMFIFRQSFVQWICAFTTRYISFTEIYLYVLHS